MPRDRDKFRKYENGFDKQKKKVKRNKFLESQTGALVKFLKPMGEEVYDHDVTQTHDDVRNEITPRTSSIHRTTVGSIGVDTTPAPVKTISRTTESCNPSKTFNWWVENINDTGSQLANEGYSDWAHLGRALDNHEKSAIHGQNVGKWTGCEIRLAEVSTIDKQHIKLINKEKEHWPEVLKRIVSGIKYLAQHNIAFRGSNSKLCKPNNSNFLGLIEMMATFDPVMQEHLRRISASEIHDHYLGANIQNELIKLLSEKVKEEIVSDIKAANINEAVEHLKKNVPVLTVKKSCDTRWKSKIESVKALRYQIKEVHDALDEVVEATDDPKAKSKAPSLVNEIKSYEFLVALAIWSDMLFAVNGVSKNLQAEKMHLGMGSHLLQGLVHFFEQFRNEGFVAAIMVAREMSELLDIKLQIVKQRKKRKMFDYEGEDEHVLESAEQIFKVDVKELKSIGQGQLLKKCNALEASLSFEGQKDICGNNLFTELKVLRDLLPANVETAAETNPSNTVYCDIKNNSTCPLHPNTVWRLQEDMEFSPILDHRWENIAGTKISFSSTISVYEPQNENFRISFSFRGKEVHILLCDRAFKRVYGNCYWIGIDANNGTKHYLRKCKENQIPTKMWEYDTQCMKDEKISDNTEKLLDKYQWNHFSVSRKNNTITTAKVLISTLNYDAYASTARSTVVIAGHSPD
ncbi:hypothetical protein Trydic_g23197 [Trypoxylus dichotomus]